MRDLTANRAPDERLDWAPEPLFSNVIDLSNKFHNSYMIAKQKEIW